jgi:hypothetical protein
VAVKKALKENKTTKVKVVGVGGIGLCLLPTLTKYLNYEHEKYPSVELTLIDGDTFEERNRSRQDFTVTGPKATIIAQDYKEKCARLQIWDVAEYLTDSNIIAHIRENDIVFSCVDNHKTRKLISDRAQELDNVVVISGGNDFTDGNVLVHVRKDGKNMNLPIANKFHPEILNPRDKNPGEQVARMGCQQLVVSEPQLLIANNAAAATMLSAFYAHQAGQFDKNPKEFSEFYFDVLSCKVVSRTRS